MDWKCDSVSTFRRLCGHIASYIRVPGYLYGCCDKAA